MALSGPKGVLMQPVARDQVVRLLRTLAVAQTVDVASLDDTIPLVKQGFDSLDMMDLYFKVEEDYAIKISDDSLDRGDWNTLQRL